MEHGAIDLHTRRSQVRIVAQNGTVVLDRRIDTTRGAFASLFGDRAPMQILLEASTDAEWVAQSLEALGRTVIVADPNYSLMYGQRTRRIETDKRDAAALAEACRLGIYRPAHRVSPGQWRERPSFECPRFRGDVKRLSYHHGGQIVAKAVNMRELALRGSAVRLSELRAEAGSLLSAFPSLRRGQTPEVSEPAPRPRRQRMSAAQRKAVSARMKAYWAQRRKKEKTS